MMYDKFIHMGCNHFDKFRFKPISNRKGWIKPDGGLWASPEGSPYDWEQWVIENNFVYDLNSWFMFELKQNAKVLEITNSKQLKELPKCEIDLQYIWIALDFEKLANEYDAMLVMISSDSQLYWDLYGWDCDTLLVFNPDVINVID